MFWKMDSVVILWCSETGASEDIHHNMIFKTLRKKITMGCDYLK